MLVRAVRGLPRVTSIRVTTIAALSLAAASPLTAGAQDAGNPLPATHTVKRRDTLWDISKTYLGDAFLWPEIYRLNTDIIEDPHWIYPSEVLKLPGPHAKVVAVAPPEAPAAAPKIATPVVTQPAAPRDTIPAPIVAPAKSPVRLGEYTAAPWVDERKGPKGSGYIMQAVDLPGIASHEQSQLNLYDRVMVSPPNGAAMGRQIYLSYKMGPLIEDLGQIIIPTGLIEVGTPANPGDAAMGRVIAMFGIVQQGQRLIPYDTSAAATVGRPAPVSDGKSGKVRWIYTEQVLPSMQDYVVLDISNRDGLKPGDQIELFKPRQKPTDGRELWLPEVSIAKAQVLRVTPFGATAILTSQEQPKIQEGTSARVAAKMP
jgi:hypothetical protein